MNLKLEGVGKSPILLLDQSIESAMSRVVSDPVVASGPNLPSKFKIDQLSNSTASKRHVALDFENDHTCS